MEANMIMNLTFSPEQKSRTRNLDANFLLRQHKLDLMSRFMEINNPKLKQKEIARGLGYSGSNLQCYRYDKKCKVHMNETISKNLEMISQNLK